MKTAPANVDMLIIRVVLTALLVGSTQNSSLLTPIMFLFLSRVGEEHTTLSGFMTLFLTDFNQLIIQLSSQKHFHGFLLKSKLVFTGLTVTIEEGSDCS